MVREVSAEVREEVRVGDTPPVLRVSPVAVALPLFAATTPAALEATTEERVVRSEVDVEGGRETPAFAEARAPAVAMAERVDT